MVMTGVSYVGILENYYSCEKELNNELSAIVLEADDDAQTTNASNATDNANNEIINPNKKQQFIQRAQKLIETLKGYISRAIDGLSQMLQNAWQTNYGFMKEIQDAEKKWNPIKEPIQIINYNYREDIDNFLYRPLKTIQNEISRCINVLANWRNMPEDHILKLSDEERTKKVLEMVNAPNEITNFGQYYRWLKSEFRRDKVTQTIKGTDVKKYMDLINAYNNKRQDVININNNLKNSVNRTKATLDQVMRSENVEDNEKASLMKYSTSLSHLLNLCTNIYTTVMRLHTEYSLNCRAIVRKLYAK